MSIHGDGRPPHKRQKREESTGVLHESRQLSPTGAAVRNNNTQALYAGTISTATSSLGHREQRVTKNSQHGGGVMVAMQPASVLIGTQQNESHQSPPVKVAALELPDTALDSIQGRCRGLEQAIRKRTERLLKSTDEDTRADLQSCQARDQHELDRLSTEYSGALLTTATSNGRRTLSATSTTTGFVATTQSIDPAPSKDPEEGAGEVAVLPNSAKTRDVSNEADQNAQEPESEQVPSERSLKQILDNKSPPRHRPSHLTRLSTSSLSSLDSNEFAVADVDATTSIQSNATRPTLRSLIHAVLEAGPDEG